MTRLGDFLLSECKKPGFSFWLTRTVFIRDGASQIRLNLLASLPSLRWRHFHYCLQAIRTLEDRLDCCLEHSVTHDSGLKGKDQRMTSGLVEHSWRSTIGERLRGRSSAWDVSQTKVFQKKDALMMARSWRVCINTQVLNQLSCISLVFSSVTEELWNHFENGS